jgi:iron-sulfur cluster repair protein YtfE (RIC family)
VGEHCGCQGADAIGELTEEHERIRTLGRELTLAAEADDHVQAGFVAGLMRKYLALHTVVEEQALFPALAPDFPQQIAALIGDHEDFEAALTALETDALGWTWPDAAHDLVARLVEHILEEQDGVFPAALATLGPADWQAAARARTGKPTAIVRETSPKG